MTRSFDRREKEEPVSLGLDCLCKNNDPACAECWEPVKQYAEVIAAAGVVRLPLPGDGTTQFDRDVRYRFDECLELLLRKHKDYGASNIANAPGGPLNGLRVRLHDKMARINHLIDSGGVPSNESLRDSFLDGANYFVIGLMVLDGVWPGTEHK